MAKKQFATFSLVLVLLTQGMNVGFGLEPGGKCSPTGSSSANGKYKCIKNSKGVSVWVDQTTSSGGPQNSPTTSGKTWVVPNFVGASQTLVEDWMHRHGILNPIAYNTALGYNYLESCRYLKHGTVISQWFTQPGTVEPNNSFTVISLELSC